MDQEKTETERKKEYLWGYQRAKRQMERSGLAIAEIKMGKMFPAASGNGMPKGSECSDLSKYAVMLEQAEKKYERDRYKRAEKCIEITNKIERMEKEDEKDVLMYRYIAGMKWEKIAEKMKKSLRRIHEIHGEALKHFKI